MGNLNTNNHTFTQRYSTLLVIYVLPTYVKITYSFTQIIIYSNFRCNISKDIKSFTTVAKVEAQAIIVDGLKA